MQKQSKKNTNSQELTTKAIARRKFVHWMGIGWVVTILSGAIIGCTDKTNSSQTESDTSPDTSNNNSEESQETSVTLNSSSFVKVGTVADLEKGGKILAGVSGATPVLVLRDGDSKDKLVAVKPICTHQGCSVDWDNEKKQTFCSCHGSTFSAIGEVTNGPATKPLQQYEVKIEGDAVLVKG